MKIIYCPGCKLLVAKIPKNVGILLKPGATIICSKCEQKRVALEIMKQKPSGNPFADIFSGFGGL